MSIDDLWYKNAIIYCLDVDTYMDTNGDGIGDFEGFSRRLEYLAGLDVSCVWLQPFYSSPDRDNGYDVSNYYNTAAKYGSLGDFVELANHASSLGIRLIADLVVNHTSNEHPWFQSARRDRQSHYHDWYIWSDERPQDHTSGIVFPGVQETTWTYDEQAGKYYFHQFYEFQPDLNTHLRAVREEITRIMGYWIALGVSGFRLDAVPFLIERKGAHVEHVQDFELLHEMRDFLQWRRGDAILLAEANVPPGDSIKYFGQTGDHLQMMLNFPVNQRLWYAMATADIGPLCWALEATRDRPHTAQWVHFLRSHDECDLGRLTDEQRNAVFEAFGPEKSMQLYNRGIRRRLTPMLGNDRRRVELAFNLLFSLPGTPMIQYGDEIGMGDDLSLPERECARTPMQWTSERHGGFSRAEEVFRPVISDGDYGFQRVNVADQRRDRDSLLNTIERMIRARRECPEISWGDYEILKTTEPEVLALLYSWRDVSLLTLHNFASQAKKVSLQVGHPRGDVLISVFDERTHHANSSGGHDLQLKAFGYGWFRVGAIDTAIYRREY